MGVVQCMCVSVFAYRRRRGPEHSKQGCQLRCSSAHEQGRNPLAEEKAHDACAGQPLRMCSMQVARHITAYLLNTRTERDYHNPGKTLVV